MRQNMQNLEVPFEVKPLQKIKGWRYLSRNRRPHEDMEITTSREKGMQLQEDK
jgi:hypothetical protein